MGEEEPKNQPIGSFKRLEDQNSVRLKTKVGLLDNKT